MTGLPLSKLTLAVASGNPPMAPSRYVDVRTLRQRNIETIAGLLSRVTFTHRPAVLGKSWASRLSMADSILRNPEILLPTFNCAFVAEDEKDL